MIYAGIGSRRTPENICARFSQIAAILDHHGYTLRSGGASGADSAFEKGAFTRKEIFRPKHATEASMALASTIHPVWANCDDYARKLHGRNTQIILGLNLDSPVEFVLCWTDAEFVGGTRTGILLAKQRNIPVFNFYRTEEEAAFYKYWAEMSPKHGLT